MSRVSRRTKTRRKRYERKRYGNCQKSQDKEEDEKTGVAESVMAPGSTGSEMDRPVARAHLGDEDGWLEMSRTERPAWKSTADDMDDAEPWLPLSKVVRGGERKSSYCVDGAVFLTACRADRYKSQAYTPQGSLRPAVPVDDAWPGGISARGQESWLHL